MLSIRSSHTLCTLAFLAASNPLVATACPCPVTDCGWSRFEDPSPGAPDFWWGEPIVVEEVHVCPHAARLEFLVKQRGLWVRAALVFPNPNAELLESRLGLKIGSAFAASELDHYTKRYAQLVTALNAMFRVEPGRFLSADFHTAEASESPFLEPGLKLALQWHGREILLRGYLDVYFEIGN